MVKRKRTVMSGATAMVAAGLLLTAGATAPAQAAAQSVVFEPSTVTWYGNNCKAWINTEKQSGDWYAQGLVHSWNGGDCTMKLMRYHNGEWTEITHRDIINGQRQTGWHYDGPGYKSTVCVIDWSIAANADYNCNYAGAV
ncbi:hypothetical protein ACWC09_13930 [Streptomyces sp. NPDC001617]